MTNEFFKTQVHRLQARFGERAFDAEFVMIAWGVVHDMSPEGLRRAVDVWIGSRPHTRPPLLAEFREAALSEFKSQFSRGVDDAGRALDRPWQNGLGGYLSKMFPGCKDLKTAVEVRKMEIEMARVENPNYDSMCDHKWT